MKKMHKRMVDHWSYGLVYEERVREYVVAEIYFNKDGKALSYCIAEIAAFEKKELLNALDDIKKEIKSGDIYLWNGKELKYEEKS